MRVRSLDQARRSTRPGRCGKTAPNTTRGARAGFVPEPPRDRSRNSRSLAALPLAGNGGPTARRGAGILLPSPARKMDALETSHAKKRKKQNARFVSRVNRRSFSSVNLKRSAIARKSVWGPRCKTQTRTRRGHGSTTLGDVVCFLFTPRVSTAASLGLHFHFLSRSLATANPWVMMAPPASAARVTMRRR